MEAIAEWKSFAALAVNTLGMPATGNSGHNRDSSYIRKTLYIIRKTISLWHHTQDGLRHIAIFPKHSLIAWGQMLKEGVKAVGKWK